MTRVRMRTALVLLSLLAAACGGGGSDGGGDNAADGEYGSDLLAEQATSSTAQRSSGQQTPQTSETIIRKKQSSQGGGSASGASGGTTSDGDPDPIYAASRKGNSEFAGPLLKPAPKGAKKIVYQLMVQSGKGPAGATVEQVVNMLRRVSGKTVEVPAAVELPAGPTNWKTSELHSYADRYTKIKSSTEAAVLNVLFVKGQHESSSSILGVASRADVITMFPDRYRNLGAGLNPQAIEEAVIMHETGHILSLVGLEIRPERQDKERPGHSRNKESVMYWAVETDDIINAFVGAPPKTFDREDLADLETIRNS